MPLTVQIYEQLEIAHFYAHVTVQMLNYSLFA